MPRKWLAHWPLPDGEDEQERERLIPTLGNLTLLTRKLNAKVSNGPWIGGSGKRERVAGRVATLLPDGRVEVDDVAYSSPSEAATAITGKRARGWGSS